MFAPAEVVCLRSAVALHGAYGCLCTHYLVTSGDGCLSSIDDEERSEMRYALRIAEFREPTDI